MISRNGKVVDFFFKWKNIIYISNVNKALKIFSWVEIAIYDKTKKLETPCKLIGNKQCKPWTFSYGIMEFNYLEYFVTPSFFK